MVCMCSGVSGHGVLKKINNNMQIIKSNSLYMRVQKSFLTLGNMGLACWLIKRRGSREDVFRDMCSMYVICNIGRIINNS